MLKSKAKKAEKESKKNGKKEEVPNKGQVFGRPLDYIMREDDIPYVVDNTIRWISERALDEEGLFRVPGDTHHIQSLKTKYDLDAKFTYTFTYENGMSPHTVAGLLKLYFRDLPEPVVPFRLYDQFIKPFGVDELQARLEYLRDLVKELPKPNKTLMVYLMKFLNNFTLHSANNKMTLQNLATCWAPNLLRSSDASYDRVMREAALVNTVIALLIERVDFVFGFSPTAALSTSPKVTSKPRSLSITATSSLPNTANNLMQSAPVRSISISADSPPAATAALYRRSQQLSASPPVQTLRLPVKAAEQSQTRPVQRQSAAPSASDWKEATAQDGRKYYYNVKTKETTWNVPEILKQNLSQSQPNSASLQYSSDNETSPRNSEVHSDVSSSTDLTGARSLGISDDSSPSQNSSAHGPSSPVTNLTESSTASSYASPARSNTLSLAQIKKMLDEMGVDYQDCKGRTDFVRLLMEHLSRQSLPPSLVPPPIR